MSEIKEQIRSSNPIVEVISEKVNLKRSGHNFKGRCPFHSDQHNPNFVVFPNTESFHCFACGISGDVFNFIMQLEKVSFKEAIRILADRKGIHLSFEKFNAEEEEKKRTVETTLREAAILYHKNIPQEVGVYLNGRGINDKTIEKYLIGFCGGETPFTASKENLLEAGLLYDDGNEYFKGFITFPHFYAGRIVYMSGRGYPEKAHQKPKKEKLPLNHLFNESALKGKTVVIAEGEIDTLTLLQNDFNACGVLGASSFKGEWTAKFLNCEKVYLSFDGDEAGDKANRKIAELLGEQARIVRLPQGEDINDFFKHATASDYQRLLDESLTLIQTKIKEISPDTSRMELPALLNPILKKIAELEDIAYGDALLNHFIKEHFKFKGKDIESYEAVLKKFRKETGEEIATDTPKKSFTQDQLIEALKREEIQNEISPAQDFKGGVMYFTVMIQKKPYLVTSERKLTSFEDAANQGLTLRHLEVSFSRFSPSGIASYLKNEREVKVAELYERIYAYIKRFVFLKDERYVAYFALWVMGTYLFTVFRYYPYAWLCAEKGSGKTLLMEVLSAIAFNGKLTVNPTESVLFRDVACNMTSIFIDELERMRKQDKDLYGAVMGILKAGFSVSGVAQRAEKTADGKFVVRDYPAYSPKMFAGINDIDDVLQDRTVRVPLLKKKEGEKVERYKLTDELLKLQREIRDDLYIFALQYAPQIAKLYNEEIITGAGHLENRELDIWESIFVLANVIDGSKGGEELTTAMEALSKESSVEKQEDNAAKNETHQLLNTLQAMLSELTPTENKEDAAVFNSETVLEYFKKTDDFGWIETKNALTSRLKRVCVRSDQRREGTKKVRVYIVNRKKLEDLHERYITGRAQND